MTSRIVVDRQYYELIGQDGQFLTEGLTSVCPIGDCLAPALIADAAYSGHEAALAIDAEPDAIAVRTDMPPIIH